MQAKISAPRGTKDVLPSEIYKWHALEATARETARLFGFGEIRFPTFEYTELFQRGVGDTTDIVQKEMYTFIDKGGRSITLRPEGTASVVRSVVENSLTQGALPLKYYYIIPNFRYEKPQAGRLREFHQFGVECFGAAGPEADVEVIELGADLLKRLGITKIALEINSIGCPDCRKKYNQALKDFFDARRDALCETCLGRLERNPMRIFDCKSPDCAKATDGAPMMLDCLCPDCTAHFEAVKSGLDAVGVSYRVNPMIVRGLDYYTRTVFEFISTDIGAQGTVLGGGRYDRLVEELGGQPTPGLGFAAGIERMLLAAEAEGNFFGEPDKPDIFLAAADAEAAVHITALTAALRSAGIAAERDLMGRGLKAQMKYAAKLGVGRTAVIGREELEKGVIRLRNMTDGSETECPLDASEIAARLKA